jgi:hypothetical protein
LSSANRHSTKTLNFIKGTIMKRNIKTLIASLLFASIATQHVTAHTGASEASALSVVVPVAIVASAGAGASTAVGASAAGVVALPVALSVTGATLVVKSVEASATGVICVLERASDGARVSLEIAGRSAQTLGISVGTTVSVTLTASGAIITAAGEAIAFVPNALGRALTHNERL